MIFTANRQAAQKGSARSRLCVILLSCCLVLGSGLHAQATAETTLTVNLKGISYDGTNDWRSVSLSGRFDVRTEDGKTLGRVRANPSEEQRAAGEDDVLVIEDTAPDKVLLVPVKEDFQDGFVCKEAVEVSITAGNENYFTAFAYAKQGLFAVRNTIVGSGQPTQSAEFLVLSEDGSVQLSFMTDEKGEYTAKQTLPIGEYRLMQMNASEGTLPLKQTQAFTIETYFGQPTDIAVVEVQNEPVPVANGQAELFALEPPLFEKGDGTTDTYYATIQLSGGSRAPNDLPLSDFSIRLMPTALINSVGEALNLDSTIVVESVRATVQTEGIVVRVQGLDAQGIELGEATVVPSGQQVALENAVGAMVTYIDAQTGEALVPVGFEAGALSVSIRYVPVATLATEHSISEAQITAELSYFYQYPSTDGNGLVTAQAECKPAEVRVSVPDGKVTVSFTAVCTADTSTITLSADASSLPADLHVAAVLPEGVRVKETELSKMALLLRTVERDVAVFQMEQVREGIAVIPVKSGTVSALAINVVDPCELAKTKDNPQGLSITAEEHIDNTLLDVLLDQESGAYAVLSCKLEGSLTLPEALPADWKLLTGSMYEDIDQSGTRTSNEPVMAHQGVLLKGESSGVYFGAITDEDGQFVFYAPADTIDTTATLIAVLPGNALSVGSRLTGRIEKTGLAILNQDYPISYTRMGAIEGQLALDNHKPLEGAEIVLSQEGQSVATMKTDLEGSYRFGALSEGEYQLRVELNEGSNAVLLAQENADLINPMTLETRPITLGYGQEIQLSFSAMSMGTVQGSLTQNGQPLGNIRIELLAPSGYVAEQETDGNGEFSFAALADGDYQLSVKLPDTFVVVEVDGEKTEASSDYQVSFNVPVGGTVRKVLRVEAVGSLAGNILGAAQGQTVVAASLSGQFSAQIDAMGGFVLTGLASGDYTVYAPLEEGKNLPSDSLWKITERGDMIWTAAAVKAGEMTRLPDVSYVEMTSIRGVAYVDANGDYTYAAGEQLVSGITVALQQKQGEAWVDVANVQTDEYGAYVFRDLQAGAYRVASMTNVQGMYVCAVGIKPIPMGSNGVMASEEIQLLAGAALSSQTDIAISAPASLQFSAFNDSNENGIRGEYERPITGVLVEVMAEGGETVLASGTTNESGEAMIENIRPGEHLLRVTLPDGYQITQKGTGEGIGVSCVEGSDGSVAVSALMRFESGKTLQAGAGAVPAGSFSGKVWNDQNNNGLMDPEEPGMAGVTLTLAGVKTGKIYTFVTDATGEYRFSLLRNENYNFSAELPEGTLFAKYSLTGGDLRSVFTVEGTTATRQFPVTGAADVTDKNVGVIEKGTIQGIAFFDANYNGILDEGEIGVAGVTVEVIRINNSKSMGKVVTGDNGAYSFSDLRGGEYRVRAILPDDGSIFSRVPTDGQGPVNRFEQRDGRRENSIAPVTIGNGGTASTVIGIARVATIKGTVFLNTGYSGIMQSKDKKASGIKVELRDESGAVLQSTTTNSNGNYTLTGIMPGEYTLRFLRKENYAFTRFRPTEAGGSWVKRLEGEYGVTEPITIVMGQNIEDVNAGMLPSSTLSGVFFDDLNDNGLMDEGEAGMEGVTVRLISEDAEIDLTTSVNAEGGYFFDGAMPGKYTLTYTLPDYVEPAKVVADGNTLKGQGNQITTESFQIETGTKVQWPLVGAVTLGTFEGVLFHDANANGVPDEGEAPMAGLLVTLTPDRAELEIVKAISGNDGRFSMSELRPANYQLAMQLPEGYIFSADLKESKLILDTVNEQKMTCPWEALIGRAYNAVGAVKPATITGYVFLDENRDGSQGNDEALMSSLAFELIDEAQGKTVKTATAGENGYVTFHNVRPGNYTVRFDIPQQAEPARETASTMEAEMGKMLQRGIVMREGETFDNLHTGLVSRTSIGGVAQLEENGERIALEGITIKLFQGNQTEPVQTVVTGEDGRYRFDGLWPDDYHMEAGLPEGMIFVRPDDPNYATGASMITAQGTGMGSSDTFSVQMSQHRFSENILYIRPAKVGDLAWLDLNQNGLMDADEPMIPGVTVMLCADGVPVAETQTDAYGYYLFEDAYPTTYTLRVKAYPELGITKSVPELRLISSCLTSGNGESAESDPFTVASGTRNMDFDLGFVLLEGKSMPSAIVTPPQKDWTGAYGAAN